MKFLHAADVHLGYSQYGDKERYNDFGRAYLAMIQAAIAERVDFVLLAGDLFHVRDIDPRTLFQAVEGLRRLQTAGIPALTIEGNHERPHWHDGFSWLDYLARVGLIKDLTPWYVDEKMTLAPWDDVKRVGAYVDLPGGVRVYGNRYVGASTARTVQDLANALAEQPRAAFTILMLHTGIEQVLPGYDGGLSHAQLAPLQPFVDYVALGHIHKHFNHGDWLYNPGSLETNSVQEAAWPERGYYLVEVDVAARRHQARLVSCPRRAFVRLEQNVTALTPAQVLDEGTHYLAAQAAQRRASKPVVELTLTGVLAFGLAELPLDLLSARAQELFDALLVRVHNRATPLGGVAEAPDDLSRIELERHVLRGLVENDEQRRPHGEAWVGAALQLKSMALQREGDQQIIAQVYDLLNQLDQEPA